MRVHRTGTATQWVRQRLGDHPRPFFGTRHVTGAVTSGEQRAVAHAGHRWVSDFASRQRRHRLVEPGEAICQPALHDERIATVGQGSHFQLEIAELTGQLECTARRLLQAVDVTRLARDDGEVHVALLDATALAHEQSTGACDPTLPDHRVSEPRRVEVGEGGCDEGRRPCLAGVLPLTERHFQLSASAGQVVIEKEDPSEELVGDRIWSSGHCLAEFFDRAHQMAVGER
ncbi:MAG: hypothetical protein KY447_01635 [Actinobacteria bacterium]|nr:hypothetical protein [Actinomycetota bacterium]